MLYAIPESDELSDDVQMPIARKVCILLEGLASVFDIFPPVRKAENVEYESSVAIRIAFSEAGCALNLGIAQALSEQAKKSKEEFIERVG